MPSDSPESPLSLRIAAGLTLVAAAFFAVMGIGSGIANPSTFGLGIAAVLLAWSAIVAVAAVGLARRRRWARGPVVAAALLHLASFANFVPSQPWALIGVVIALGTVAAAVWPSTTRALRFGSPRAADS